MASKKLIDKARTFGAPQFTRSVSNDVKEKAALAAQERGAQLPMAAPGTSGTGGSVAKRFYMTSYMRPSDDGKSFTVMLDRWVVKTPQKKPMSVPSAALALAIAAEWESQNIGGVRPFTMPLMKLAATALDRAAAERKEMIANLMEYCHTDYLYCRVPEDSPVHAKQAAAWDPLTKWLQGKTGACPIVSTSIHADNQPEEVVKALEKILNSYDDWELSAVDFLAANARSLVIAIAIMEERLSIDQAINAIRVEEDHQISCCGFVEGGHDIDIADLKVKIAAGSMFQRLLKLK